MGPNWSNSTTEISLFLTLRFEPIFGRSQGDKKKEEKHRNRKIKNENIFQKEKKLGGKWGEKMERKTKMITIKKKKQERAQIGTSVTLFRGFFWTFNGFLFRVFRELFGAFSKPHPEKEGQTPNHEKEANSHLPEGRANIHREGRARKKGRPPLKKNGQRPNPNPENKRPTPSREGMVNSKEGPKPTPRGGRAKHQPREARANPFREGKNNLHSEGQVQEGPLKEGMANLPFTSKKEGPVPSREKEKPTPTKRRTGQTQPQEGRVHPPHPEKPGPTALWRTKNLQEGRATPPHQKDRTNSHLKKDNPEKEGHLSTLRRNGEPSPQQQRPTPTVTSTGQAIAIAIWIAIAIAFSIRGLIWSGKTLKFFNFQVSNFNFQIWRRATPYLKIQNLQDLQDQIRQQVENTNRSTDCGTGASRNSTMGATSLDADSL